MSVICDRASNQAPTCAVPVGITAFFVASPVAASNDTHTSDVPMFVSRYCGDLTPLLLTHWTVAGAVVSAVKVTVGPATWNALTLPAQT